MPSTYTLNNGIELIATGEQSGTWGDTTNTNLSLLDTALDGQVTVTLTSAGTSGSPNDLPITDGTASNGRNRMVIFNDGADLGATAYVQLTPNDAEKIIYVRNDLSGSRSIILFQGTYSASNDYEVPAGTTAVIYFDGAGSGAVAANVFNNAYFDSLRLGSVSVTAILDEDDMSSDSATSLATQQSIKAYVDSQVTAQDLDFGGDSGTGAVDLDSQTFTIAGTANEIETSASGQTLTVGLPDDVTIAGDLTVDTDTLYVDSTNDRVGIGESSPDSLLHLTGTSTAYTTVTMEQTDTTLSTDQPVGQFLFKQNDTSGVGTPAKFGAYAEGASGEVGFRFLTGSGNTASEAMRITSSQRVLINTTADQMVAGGTAILQVMAVDESTPLAIARFQSGTAAGPFMMFGKSRSSTVGSYAILQEDDTTGIIRFAGDDGTDLTSRTAEIYSEVDGTPGTNDMPGRLVFATTADGSQSATERMRIHSSGDISMSGSSGTVGTLKGRGSLTISDNHGDNTGGAVAFHYTGNGGYSEIYIENNNTLVLNADPTAVGSNTSIKFRTDNTLAAMIDDSQRVLVGTSDSINGYYLQVAENSGYAGVSALRYTNDAFGAYLNLGKSRTTTIGGNTIVQDDDVVGYITFSPNDGTDLVSISSQIQGEIDGTPGANDVPGRLVFKTTADGAASSTERMRISQNGYVGIGTSGDPLRRLTVKATDGTNQVGRFESTESAAWVQFASGSTGTASRIGSPDNTTNASVAFVTADVERMRVDPNGHVLIGHTSGVVHQGEQHELQVSDTNFSLASFATYRNGSDGAMLALSHSRNTTKGSQTILNADDNMGGITFFGSDGTDFARGAQIRALVDGTPGNNDMPGRIIFSTSADGTDSPTERMRIDSAGNVGVGETDPDVRLHSRINTATEWDTTYNLSNSNNLPIYALGLYNDDSSITNTEVNLLFSAGSSGSGQHSIGVKRTGTNTGNLIFRRRNSGSSLESMRVTTNGDVLINRTSNATVGDATGFAGKQLRCDDAIMTDVTATGASGAFVGHASSGPAGGIRGLIFSNNGATIAPSADNGIDLGNSSLRWDDIYATNATIQTSDQNEKQQIAALTDAEITAAKAISRLFKTFKWNDSVVEKGDAARTHSGVIAQEVEQAMTDAGLNANDYAFFINSTWYLDANGNNMEADDEGAILHNRKGIRYPELLSFIGAATEQRLASIEARLDALETS